MSLEQLKALRIAHVRFQAPVVAEPRGLFALRVRCAAGTAECTVGLLAFGMLEQGFHAMLSPRRTHGRGMPV